MNGSFDLGRTLRIGSPSNEPLLPAGEDEVVIRFLQPITLMDLANSEIGRCFMHQQDWLTEETWAHEPIPAGTYRLRLATNCFGMQMVSQIAHLASGEQVAPVALVVAALLCIMSSATTDEELPLEETSARCLEASVPDTQGAVVFLQSRLIAIDFLEKDAAMSDVTLAVLVAA